MPIARNKIYNPEAMGYYHCVVRCVRRSYLCGYDVLTGKSFEHRRQWIKDRLHFLLEVFAIDCFSYAVMNNHLHIVIRNNPEVAKTWSNVEVAKRWRKLFTKSRNPEENELDIKWIADNSELVEKYRKRLSCISWFNRCMNENIAKRANKEDECKGRFWEGRFTSQRLDSEAAIIACGVYVDLNPIRAKVATTPENSDYTSVQDRIRKIRGSSELRSPRLLPVAEVCSLSEKEYIEAVDLTGRELKHGKRGKIDSKLKPILERIKLEPDFFLHNAAHQSKLFTHFIGNVYDLNDHARRLGLRFVRGINSARQLFMETSTTITSSG